jgi:GMP synthase-like glutamine amidotransferase
MHRDIVLGVPEGIENLGSSPRCQVQGLYLRGRVFTLQAHPEFDAFITSKIIALKYEQGIFTKKIEQDALSRAELNHDGAVVGRVICKFLLDI